MHFATFIMPLREFKMLAATIYTKICRDKAKKNDGVYLKPSDVSSCIRKLYYAHSNFDIMNDIKKFIVYANRVKRAIRDDALKIIKESTNVERISVDVKKQNFVGKAKFKYNVDCAFMYGEKKTICLIKPLNSLEWSRCIVEPEKEHVIELYTYMALEKTNKGLVLYINIDSGAMTEYHYDVSDPVISSLVDVIKTVWNTLCISLVSKTAPPRRFADVSAPECRRCCWCNYCWTEDFK